MAESKVATLEGHELADDYVRTHVPQGRWSDTWGLFKANFVKLVIINVLTLLFFVPGITLIYFRNTYIQQMGLLYPFSANAGIIAVTPSIAGLAEQVIFTSDLMFYSVLIVAGFIASVGLSGAAYSIKKLINTHGQFTIKGFFHGVKVCYFNTVFAVTLFMIFMFGSLIISDWAAMYIAKGGNVGGAITAKVFMIIATVVVGIIACWIWAVGVSYKVKFKYLIKNSFVLLFGSIIQTIFMLGFALVPVWFMIIGLTNKVFLIIGCIIFIFIGFSSILLCWFAYTQWVFDMFITPAVKAEKDAERAKMTPKQLEALKEEEEKKIALEILAAGKSELIGRPIKPIDPNISVGEIGITYGRADIKKAAQARCDMQSGIEKYYEEHKNDTRYTEYNKLFAEREKALSSPDKKGKKKKVSSDNLLGK